MVNQGSFVKEQFAALPDLGSQISLTSSNVHMVNNALAPTKISVEAIKDQHGNPVDD